MEDTLTQLPAQIEAITTAIVGLAMALTLFSKRVREALKHLGAAVASFVRKIKDALKGGPGGPGAAASIALVLTLGACSGVFGPAETNDQRAFQAAGKYLYVATLVEAYVAHPRAKPAVVSILQTVDKRVYASLQEAITAYQVDPESNSRLLPILTLAEKQARERTVSEMVANVGSFTLQVLGQVQLPTNPAEIAGRTLVLSTIGARSAVEMDAIREGYLVPKLEAMEKSNRGPTAAEWQELNQLVSDRHRAIQG